MKYLLRAALLALAIATPLPGMAQSASEAEQPAAAEAIDGDRPHVGTGTHVIEPGQVQFEVGGQYQSSLAASTYGSPILVRIGVTDIVEARVSSDGLIGRFERDTSNHGIGNVQIGAKIRLRGHRDEPWLSLLPTVNLGVASAEKGLGAGATDTTLTLLAGHGLGERTHVEANYGIGLIGEDRDRSHFVQSLVTAALVYRVATATSTYVEVASWSRQEARGTPVTFTDFGVIYAASPRVVFDVGASIGLTVATPDYSIFSGVSFIIGEPHRWDRRRVRPAPR